MEKFPPLSQILKISFLLFFLLLTPFVPNSLRSPYLYFLFNILLLVLGVESGFLKAVTGPRDDKKSFHFPPHVPNPNFDVRKISTSIDTAVGPTAVSSQTSIKTNQQAKVLQAPIRSSNIIRVKTLKKCPSRPTIFFIGGSESDGEFFEEKKKQNYKEEEKGEWMGQAEEMMSKHELFTKAESFIGNFYSQLQMQRKESWSKIHELYHKGGF